MCVALILILNSFYKYYDTLLSICEHITGAFLLLITVSLILLPFLLWNFSEPSPDDVSKPYIAIVVLVCGVIGGLIVVISFMFFCKYCFKEKQPLANSSLLSSRRHSPISKPKNLEANYKILKGINNALVGAPVPADLEAYLQQPNNNKNVDDELLKPLHSKNSPYSSEMNVNLQKQLEENYERRYPTSPKAAAMEKPQNSLNKTLKVPNSSPKYLDIVVDSPHGNNLSLGQQRADKRNRANSTIITMNCSTTKKSSSLAVPDVKEEFRRRSYDDRQKNVQHDQQLYQQSGTFKRQLPSLEAVDNYTKEMDRIREMSAKIVDKTADEYHRGQRRLSNLKSPSSPMPLRSPSSSDRRLSSNHKCYSMDESVRPPPASRMVAVVDQTPAVIRPYPNEHHFMRTGGCVVNRAVLSPTSIREQEIRARTLAAAPDCSADGNKGYQGNARFILLQNQARRMNSENLKKSTIVDVEDENSGSSCSSANSGFSGVPSQRIQVRQAKSMDPQRNILSLNDSYRQRQARSLEAAAQQKFGRQSSFGDDDFFSNYGNYGPITSQNRIVVPPSVIRENEFHPKLLRVGSSAEGKKSSTVIRKIDFEPADDKNWFSDVSEKTTITTTQKIDVERQCKNLWNLRATLEHNRRYSATNNHGEGDEDTVLLDSISCYYNDLNDDGGGTTSYATSFESNTEPSAFDDYVKSANTAPLGSYLVPPRLSVEDKRAKLKGLYAKRQVWAQETGGGASIESYEESFETNGTPDLTNAKEQNSFESNQASDSTTDTKRKVFQKDSGFKSQSMGENEQATAAGLAKRPPIIARKVTSFDSSTSYPDFEASLTNSDSDVGDNNRSSDKYRTIHQNLIPTNPQNFRSRIFSVPDHDYAVDTYSDNIFRQFSKIDPKYEYSSPHHSSRIKNRNAVIGNRKDIWSQEDSIEENHDTALSNNEDAGRAFVPLVMKNDAVVLG